MVSGNYHLIELFACYYKIYICQYITLFLYCIKYLFQVMKSDNLVEKNKVLLLPIIFKLSTNNILAKKTIVIL